MLGIGAASSLVEFFVSRRMDLVDLEGHPVQLSWRMMTFFPWLLWGIVKANVSVARIIISPKLRISPRVFRIKAAQKSELAQVINANSTILKPDTVAIGLDNGEITVRTLTQEAADDLRLGELDRRVCSLEENE